MNGVRNQWMFPILTKHLRASKNFFVDISLISTEPDKWLIDLRDWVKPCNFVKLSKGKD